MANIKNIVQVMNFHSLIRVDKAKREANKYFGVEDEINRLLYSITNNKNLKLDKKLLLTNDNGDILNIYIGNDLGFCGDFNYLLQRSVREDKDAYKIVIGRKLFQHVDDKIILKIEKDKFLDEYYKIDDIITDYISNKKIKEINVIFNHYYNVNDIKFEKRKLFPLEINVDDKKDVNLDVDYVMETDVNELLTKMISIAICYQIKVFESNSWASENVMREKITRESIDKIDKIEKEKKLEEVKNKKEASFKKQINNYKNTMR